MCSELFFKFIYHFEKKKKKICLVIADAQNIQKNFVFFQYFEIEFE